MNVSIRLATPTDAPAIAAVAAEVWPNEPLNAVIIGRLIAESARATFVAEFNGEVVGFVDGFATWAASGDARWEVDLLAVSTAAQGRGIGNRLVGESIAAGVAIGAKTARALIRVGNFASERVFATHGFVTDRDLSDLWVADDLVPDEAQTLLHIVPVRTFRYAGLWLEDVTSEALQRLRPSDNGEIIGAVIRVTDHEASASASAVGLQVDGQYRFWQRALAASAG